MLGTDSSLNVYKPSVTPVQITGTHGFIGPTTVVVWSPTDIHSHVPYKQ